MPTDRDSLVTRVASLAGVEADAVQAVQQVHGDAVSMPATPLDEADAVVTDRGGAVVMVRTADCVPILLSSGAGRVVAAVHAGWRGLLAGVIPNAVQAICELSEAEVRQITALIGPCISGERYEVGNEVAGPFASRWPDAVLRPLGEKPRLDLRHVAVSQLLEAGLNQASIANSDVCTYEDVDRCYSYRRVGKGVGHHAAWIRCNGS